ncbi:hypothetical protein GCM10027614_02410 [Micromonospora vulcania]
MRGYMDAYRVSCARKVIEAVRARGLHERAAVIAITTTIVETGIRNISEEVDHDSLGLFQQRASWGTVAERLNPSVATNKFLSKMLTKYPNNTWRTAPIGEVCQAVQVSAYPSRYQPEAGDAQIIVDVLSNRVSLSDYNGDGTSEIAVFRPSIREWHSYGKVLARDWGQPGDIPLAGDYDGDGTSDIAIFRPTTGEWHSYGKVLATGWGQPGDIPLSGDYDGDGTSDIAIFRPTTGEWHSYGKVLATGWGRPGDIPLSGDYTGDGISDIALYRPSTREWMRYGKVMVTGWGQPGDIPLSGDYNGDGTSDIAIFRPSTGEWHRYGAVLAENWGEVGDIPTGSYLP